MKTLTLKQPWATLVAEGYKEYEFRTWKTSYRGPLYIHAGKGVDKEALKQWEHLNLEYPTGMILAKCELVDCILVDDQLKKKLKQKDSLVYQNIIKKAGQPKYAFKLEKVKKVKPIPASGKLSFWEYKEK